MTNDDMVRRTIQKLSKLENSDIKEFITTDKKEKNFETEYKEIRAIKNLRKMLLNKHYNTDIKEEQIFGYSVTNFNESENLDDNNKEVNDFFSSA